MNDNGQVPAGAREGEPFSWHRVRGYWRQKRFDRGFWNLYASSFLVDLGLCLYFFMFNLFLLEHRFTEHAIGYITSAFTIGIIAGTFPVTWLSARFGLRAMMLAYVCMAPLCFALRTLFLQMPAQMGLAFLAGLAVSIWSVCFSPTLAKLTTQENRAFAFSLFVATGIGSGVLAGLIGGYVPAIVDRFRPERQAADGYRVVLLLACVIISLAGFAIRRLPRVLNDTAGSGGPVFTRFLARILTAIAIWSFALGFFTPFANIYLSRHLGLPVTSIGAIYSSSQLLQIAAVLLAPLLYRSLGLIGGVAITQMGTAMLLWALSRAAEPSTAIRVYLLLTALQWMGGPGISSLLMNRTPESQRSGASAMQNLVNLAAQAASAAFAGKLFASYGYSGPLATNAAIAALAALVLYSLLNREETSPHAP